VMMAISYSIVFTNPNSNWHTKKLQFCFKLTSISGFHGHHLLMQEWKTQCLQPFLNKCITFSFDLDIFYKLNLIILKNLKHFNILMRKLNSFKFII
jgi:hypothetical protein